MLSPPETAVVRVRQLAGYLRIVYFGSRVMLVMPNKKILDELKKLLRQRGRVTRQQKEYAKAEERAMMEIYTEKKYIERSTNRK